MPHVAIVERLLSGMGRNQNLTYVRVVTNTRALAVDAATFVSQNPTHPWADPVFREFIVDLTDQEAADIEDGTNPLTWNVGNQPRWQQETDGSGSTKSFGSFADPESAASAFTADVPVPDDRFIVRLYDGDPLGAGVHIASLDLDEGQDAGRKVINLRLFSQNDVPSGTNAQNQLTEIAGKLMIFDFTAGITTFGVNTNLTGSVSFPSNHQYRVLGPGGEIQVNFRVFGTTLDPTND